MIRKIIYYYNKKIVTDLLQRAINHRIIRPRKAIILLRLVEKDELVCDICNRSIIKLGEATCDHIIPQSKGGSYSDIKNYQLAHKNCNCKKGDKLINYK